MTRPVITLTVPLLAGLLALMPCGGENPIQDEASVSEAFRKAAPEGLADLTAMQDHFQAVLKRVRPATVMVQTSDASGSGVLVSKDGYILTAAHVSGASGRDARVCLPDGRILKAKTLGANKRLDYGLIKVTDAGEFPFAEMGKSAEVTAGQWLLALGYPGEFRPGRSPVVRVGRVASAAGAKLRTDCLIEGGDSGGPLFDLAGKVIGVHQRAGRLSEDCNYHIPVDLYRGGWDRLLKGEVWDGK